MINSNLMYFNILINYEIFIPDEGVLCLIFSIIV